MPVPVRHYLSAENITKSRILAKVLVRGVLVADGYVRIKPRPPSPVQAHQLLTATLTLTPRAGGFKEDPDIASLADWEVTSVKKPGTVIKILPKGASTADPVVLQVVATGGDPTERRTVPVSVSAVAAAISSLDSAGIAQVATKILATLPRRDKGKERFKTAAQQQKDGLVSGTARKKRCRAPSNRHRHAPTHLLHPLPSSYPRQRAWC